MSWPELMVHISTEQRGGTSNPTSTLVVFLVALVLLRLLAASLFRGGLASGKPGQSIHHCWKNSVRRTLFQGPLPRARALRVCRYDSYRVQCTPWHTPFCFHLTRESLYLTARSVRYTCNSREVITSRVQGALSVILQLHAHRRHLSRREQSVAVA